MIVFVDSISGEPMKTPKAIKVSGDKCTATCGSRSCVMISGHSGNHHDGILPWLREEPFRAQQQCNAISRNNDMSGRCCLPGFHFGNHITTPEPEDGIWTSYIFDIISMEVVGYIKNRRVYML